MSDKTLLSESQIKEILREEFAAQGVILTEEQLEELFGLFGKSKLIKQIKQIDPEGSELEKLGYDANPEALKRLGKGALKGILTDLRNVTGTKAPKGFVQKVKDVYAGVKDIGILGGGAGTLLGGEETFDIEKRKALKDTAKKQIEGWLKKLDYEPLLALYISLGQQGFPNNDQNDFMGNTAEIYNEYDKVVKDFEKEQVDCKRANTIIAVLRALVIYYQDFGMSDKYFYVNEQEDPMGAAQGAVSKNFIAAYGNKLPLGLAAAGVACLAAGFAADSEFFQNFLQGFKDMETIPTESDILRTVTSTVDLGDVKGGEGIIKVVRRMTPMKDFATSGGPGMAELGKYPMIVKLIGAAMVSQQGPGALAQAIQQNANPAQLFVSGPASGTARAGEELFGLNKGQFEQTLTKVIGEKVKSTANVPADTLKNKFLNSLGTLLGPILKALGLGALVAALASFAMRQKGKGKMGGSRMSRLKGIVDEMTDVPCDEKEDEECPAGQTRNPETGECEDDEGEECPEGQTRNPKTGECEDDDDDGDDCEEGYERNEDGECVPLPPEFNGPYKLKLNALVEPMIRMYAKQKGLEVDEDAMEELIQGLLDQNWAGPQANKGADQFDLEDPAEYAGIAEALDDTEEDLTKRIGGAERKKKRRRYKSKKGHLINVSGSRGRSKRHRSLNWHLKQALLGAHSAAANPLPGATDKQKKYLIRQIVQSMKADLVDQGAEVSQQEQQQEAKRLTESLQLDRWKVIAGIK